MPMLYNKHELGSGSPVVQTKDDLFEMKICVTQREGIRYFSRFADIAERDKLEIELKIEDKNGKTVLFDLTSALIEEYAKHPDVGRIDPEASMLISASRRAAPVVIKGSRTVSPAYLTESRKQKDEFVAKVREAQMKVVEEKKQRRAELAAARAKQLEVARKAKAESAKPTKPATKTSAAKASAKKTAAPKPTKTDSKASKSAK